MLDLPKPLRFACSPKWIRNVKTRLGLVDGKLAPYKEPSFDEVDGTGSGGSWTSEARSSSPEPSGAVRGTFPAPSPKASPLPTVDLASPEHGPSPTRFASAVIVHAGYAGYARSRGERGSV